MNANAIRQMESRISAKCARLESILLDRHSRSLASRNTFAGTAVNSKPGKMHEHQRNNLRFRGIVSDIPRLFAIVYAAKRTVWKPAYSERTPAANRLSKGNRYRPASGRGQPAALH
jgi:hypothetical protein